jgi:hypothetical protein
MLVDGVKNEPGLALACVAEVQGQLLLVVVQVLFLADWVEC